MSRIFASSSSARKSSPLARFGWALLLAAGTADAATFTVTNTNDSGAGSLRQAITSANGTSAVDTIVFSVNQAGVVVINLQSPLPALAQPVTLDGLSQSGGSGPPRVQLNGASAGSAVTGLSLTAPGCTHALCIVKGLQITRFSGDGIGVQSNWTIRSNYIGNDGSQVLANTGSGILVNGSGSFIGGAAAADGNVISGNGIDGIRIIGDSNFVSGNLIGLNAGGTAALPNSGSGIDLDAGADGNTIGAPGNVISGNTGVGVRVFPGALTTNIWGNLIGVNAIGAAAIPNASGLELGAIGTAVGSNMAADRNVISGNTGTGIQILATAGNLSIRGNRIGTNATGTAAVPNGAHGLRVVAANGMVDVGGAAQGEGNLISGNGGIGIDLDAASLNVRIRGNKIGTNVAGAAAIPNASSGVSVGGGGHTLGGATLSSRNQISGNGANGVVFNGLTSAVSMTGNYVGTDGAGTAAIPNVGGIRVVAANANLTIGGLGPLEWNLVSGNLAYGLAIDGGTNGVLVRGNRVGTTADGGSALPNQGAGLGVGGTNHVIGGTTAAARNVISGNTQDGIDIAGVATGTAVLGNYIGTNVSGSAAVPNGGSGIRVLSPSPNISIGDGGTGGNVISGNLARGVALDDTSNAVSIRGNRIGASSDGTAAVPNGETGILLNGNNHLIGGSTVGARNQISGNAGNGITSSGGGATSIQGNYIGTDRLGAAALPNTAYGVRVVQTSGMSIGASNAGAGNLISGNGRGLSIEALANNVTVSGNIVGLNANATASLPNGSGADAISITGPNTTIGGTVAGAGNVIAGNASTAISVRLASASNARIQGNWIGTNQALAANLGNQVIGILIDRADGVLIGGTVPGAGNVVANNGFIGIFAENGTRNSILGNAVFGNTPLQVDIAEQGPEINDPLDPDGGGNRRQNFPVIHSALYGGGNVALQASLASTPAASHRVEFFQASACAPGGLGGANLYLGAQQVTTDTQGNAGVNLSVPAANANGVITAIATAADGSSSEFSPCHAITGPNPGSFEVWRSPLLGYEGIAAMRVIVVRALGNAGAATVQLATMDGNATSPADYGSTMTTLAFADGEVMRRVDIPIVADALNEGQEQFFIQLSNPTGGATLGPLATVPAVIIENPVPFFSVSDGVVNEPASGMALMTFSVSLSPSSSPRTIEYFTEDATATGGLDYQSRAGVLNFPASAATQWQTVDVPVLADALNEPQESFYLRASASGNIAVYDGTGEGAILPPETALPDAVFKNGFE